MPMVITTRTLFWLGLVVSLLAWLAVGALIFTLSPESATVLVFFFAFLFLAVGGLVSAIIGAILRYRQVEKPAVALRQGMLVGLLAVILALLQYLAMLDMLAIVASVALVVLAEVLVQQRSRWRQRPSPSTRGGKATTMAAHKRSPRRSRRKH